MESDTKSFEDETKNETDNNEKSTETSFKRPLLVGKIGRLPKKLKNLKPATEINTPEEVAVKSNEIDDKQDLVVPKSNDDVQKSESFSLQYKEPTWSGSPKSTAKNYNFEILKDGSIIDTINLTEKCYWVFGRLANCDIPMQHPTISRYHAILQYRIESDENNEVGFYVYDLGSTHGTFLNKNKLRPRVFVRIQVGHILKLGCSTRSYLLNGPEEDTEKESELSVSELKQKRREELEKRERERIEELQRIEKEKEDRKKREEEKGIDWGMGEDADEETDISENPYAQSNNEELYLDDPKKTLRGFFEREGLNLEYDCSEQGMGQFLCKVELPIDDDKGRSIYAEIIHKGKKKEAVIQCALEACRILDRHGLLRQAVHESRKRKAKDWAENDYYDSDDDTFLDRTGEIEKKREKRMNTKNAKKPETYESLMVKEKEIASSIKKVENQLIETQEKAKNSNNTPSEEDSLDAFMKDLKDSKPDKTAISKLKVELTKLKQEHAKVIKLVNIAKPANLPPLVPQYSSELTEPSGKGKVLPVFGKRRKVPVVVPQKKSAPQKMEEDDEDEEQVEETNSTKNKTAEESSTGSKTDKISDVDVNIENSKIKSEYGLQNLNEINKTKLSGTDEFRDGLVEDECTNILNKVINTVELKFKQISQLSDPKIRKQKLENLVSSVRTGAKKLLDDINEIHVEECRKAEVEEVEKSDDEIKISIEENTTEDAIKKKKNQRRIQQRQEKAEIEKRKGYAEDAKKEDYNMWVPPKDQTGDGKTKLNERFGY